MREAWKERPSAWGIGAFLLPTIVAALVLVVVGPWQARAIGTVLLLVAATVPLAWPVKHLGLVIALFVWLWGVALAGRGVAAYFPSAVWLFVLLMPVLAVVLVWATLRIGAAWQAEKLERLARKGRSIREWEWVYVGRDAALSHPLAAHLGGARIVAMGSLAQAIIWVGSALAFATLWWHWALLAFGAALVGLTLTLVWTRHPAAWGLVWFHLVLGMPLSFPLMFYWADGVRPNLIYRHRFERLVPETTEGVV